ncbi:MAG: geranylgeranyl reductase family protein, partial [Thermoleophilia bacterium]|nr:geranylgeranyl reductase family protein [Thermoleophilia bacterium]
MRGSAEEHWADVVSVGAGPAGCAAATFLAREGVDVLAVDRATFPRDKVCGDGLGPRSVSMLRRMGVERRLRDLSYQPIHHYRVVSAWGDAVRTGVPAFGKGAGYAHVVPRQDLDLLLVGAAREAGTSIWEGVRALRGTEVGGMPAVEARGPDGRSLLFRGRVVVGADGSRGSFSRTVLPARRSGPYAVGMRAYVEGVEGLDGALNFFLDRDLLPGCGWIFPSGRAGGPANVGLGLPTRALRRRPERLRDVFDRFLGPTSLAGPHLQGARLAAPPALFPLRSGLLRGTRRQGNVLLAGDAASLIDPLSGEGVAYALESGHLAALAIARALRSGRLSELARYEATVWKELSFEFLGAYLLRQILARPWGNGLMVRLLQRDAGLARGGLGLLSNTVPATWLLRPMIWRRVLTPRRLVGVVSGRDP